MTTTARALNGNWAPGSGTPHKLPIDKATPRPPSSTPTTRTCSWRRPARRVSESPETAHHLAQLHFLTGSIYAIDRKDDATAVRWFDRALPQLQATFPGSLLDERGLIGEQLVSVGISLWETGRRNTAVSVTEEGASLIAQAVADGAAKKSALSVPYQNLAEMHRQLGNTDEADRLADKAVEVDPDAGKAVKRR